MVRNTHDPSVVESEKLFGTLVIITIGILIIRVIKMWPT